MSVFKSVAKFLSDTKAVANVADLEVGRAGAEGIVRLGPDGPLVSPVRGQPCVAFFYTAIHVVGGRMPQPRKLRVEEVYHSFDLEMEGGRIHVVPKKSDEFSSDDHKELSGVGYVGFRAVEDLVSAGSRVRLFGTLKREGDEWTLRYRKLEMIQGASAGTNGAPSTAKKNKKSGSKKRKKR